MWARATALFPMFSSPPHVSTLEPLPFLIISSIADPPLLLLLLPLAAPSSRDCCTDMPHEAHCHRVRRASRWRLKEVSTRSYNQSKRKLEPALATCDAPSSPMLEPKRHRADHRLCVLQLSPPLFLCFNRPLKKLQPADKKVVTMATDRDATVLESW